MSILVSSQGEEALIQGDVLVHPAQVTEDDWNCHFDHDWPVSTDTRRKMLEDAEAKGTPVVSCHFPAPGFGTGGPREGRRYWQVGLGRTGECKPCERLIPALRDPLSLKGEGGLATPVVGPHPLILTGRTSGFAAR